jgi:hypothetical protein
MYLSRYLRSVNLRFLLYFCANSISFVFNHLSISSFIGFHGLNTPFYSVIFYVILSQIPLTRSHAVLDGNRTICWLLLSFYHSWVDSGSYILWFPTKPSKTISPPRKPEGITVHGVHCAVSPEIILWVAAMIRLLHPGNEWRSGIEPCDLIYLL